MPPGDRLGLEVFVAGEPGGAHGRGEGVGPEPGPLELRVSEKGEAGEPAPQEMLDAHDADGVLIALDRR